MSAHYNTKEINQDYKFISQIQDEGKMGQTMLEKQIVFEDLGNSRKVKDPNLATGNFAENREFLPLHYQHSKLQPDNFMYVKKFANLDTVNHYSHKNSFSMKNDQNDSLLLNEPIDQIFDETTNNLFRQHIVKNQQITIENENIILPVQ